MCEGSKVKKQKANYTSEIKKKKEKAGQLETDNRRWYFVFWALNKKKDGEHTRDIDSAGFFHAIGSKVMTNFVIQLRKPFSSLGKKI